MQHPNQRKQLWTVSVFSACNPNRSAPMINRYNKSDTCRSCSKSNLSIPPPCQYQRQVILFRSFLRRLQLFSARHTQSLPQQLSPVGHFSPFHLLVLTPEGFRQMSPTKEVRYTSRSITPPPKRRSRSISPPRLRARSRSRSQDSVDASNPGNNLYITGLSMRVTSSDLEKYVSKEGKVLECQVVTDPRTRESRGFAFVTMDTVEDAERCVKYLNRSVLEGRLITVEKAKRRRGRTPTPGKYCGSRERRDRGRRRSRSHSPYRSRQRDRSHSRSRRERSRSPYSRDSHRRRRERSMSAASGDNH